MIFGKMWRAIRAQFNKLANFFWSADPIAQMQYEYDTAVEELKTGRQGLEQYRALVERVSRQAESDRRHMENLEAKVKAYLKAGDRETAGKFALELQKAKQQLQENQTQLDMHEKAYENNVQQDQACQQEVGGSAGEDFPLRRGTQDEPRGSGNGPAGAELRFRRHDRLRADRTGPERQDRLESGQGARGGRSVHGRTRGNRAR